MKWNNKAPLYWHFWWWESTGTGHNLIKHYHAITPSCFIHDDVIKWKHFPRNWPFVRGIHRSPLNSPHKGQWRGALMFSLICVWINGWVNNREAGDLRRYRAHYDVTVTLQFNIWALHDVNPYGFIDLGQHWFIQCHNLMAPADYNLCYSPSYYSIIHHGKIIKQFQCPTYTLLPGVM